MPATAEAYLRTEQGTVAFLLTQTEGGWGGGWRDEWRSGEGMWGMWREGETDNGVGAGMCSQDDKVGGHKVVHEPQRMLKSVHTHIFDQTVTQPGGKLWCFEERGDSFYNRSFFLSLPCSHRLL